MRPRLQLITLKTNIVYIFKLIPKKKSEFKDLF